MDSYMGDSYLKHCRSLERQSSQPSIWLVWNGVLLTNHMAGTSKTKYNYNQVTTQKPKQQSMKITKIHKTKPNESKTGFRSTFAPSAPRKRIGPILQVMRLHTGEDEEEWDETVQVTGALHQILHIVNDQWCGHSQNLKANAKAWSQGRSTSRPLSTRPEQKSRYAVYVRQPDRIGDEPNFDCLCLDVHLVLKVLLWPKNELAITTLAV